MVALPTNSYDSRLLTGDTGAVDKRRFFIALGNNASFVLMFEVKNQLSSLSDNNSELNIVKPLLEEMPDHIL